MPTAHIHMYNGAPTLFLDGAPVFAGMQWLSGLVEPDGSATNDDAIRAFAAAGIHLNAFTIGEEWCGPRPGHPAPFDFSRIEPVFKAIVAADPQAMFHLRIYLETASWWNEMHPDECEVSDDGNRLQMSYASPVWQAEVKDYLRRLIAYLRQIGMYDRTIAYQVCPGVCGEWVKNHTAMTPLTGDYSAPMRRYFRRWLRRKYGNYVFNLRKAWQDDEVTFDTAEVPSAKEQHRASRFSLRDPVRDQKAIDYLQALADLVADTLIDFCRTIKAETNNEKLAGAFYGYLMDQAWNDCFFGGPGDGSYSTIQRSGHLGLRKVLRAPEVDFIVSPYGYAFRGLGGDGLAMPPSESLRLHGKLYIYEEDSRLHNLMDPDGRNYAFEHAVAIHQRCMSNVLTHAFGVWWLADWPPKTYATHPKTEPSAFNPWLPRFRRLGEFSLHLDRRPQAEVAVIVDDESFLYESLRNSLNLPGIFYQRVEGLARFGAPHDVYLLDDLVEGKLPPYKLYLFLNAWHLDTARREKLKRELRRDGRVAVWIYAAGYLNRDAECVAALNNMADLTGIAFEKGDNPWAMRMHITNFTHPITREVAQDLFWGTTAPLGPIFHVKDGEAITLGQVVYSLGRCKPGMVVKEFAEWKSVYIAAPNVPAPILRGIARYAGVHLYSDAGDVLHATRELLGVHTIAGGPRTFKLPHCAEVIYDLYHDRELARDASEFCVELPPASSALYYTGSREKLAHLR